MCVNIIQRSHTNIWSEDPVHLFRKFHYFRHSYLFIHTPSPFVACISLVFRGLQPFRLLRRFFSEFLHAFFFSFSRWITFSLVGVILGTWPKYVRLFFLMVVDIHHCWHYSLKYLLVLCSFQCIPLIFWIYLFSKEFIYFFTSIRSVHQHWDNISRKKRKGNWKKTRKETEGNANENTWRNHTKTAH